jgi:gliding motility-associated-like protein
VKSYYLKSVIFITAGFFLTGFLKAQYIQHNWPLNQLRYDNFQWAGNSQHFLSKIKYSDKNFRTVLFNNVYNTSNLPIGAEGPPTSSYHTFFSSQYISLLRTDTTGVYDWIKISGSSTCYARDFDTDTSENMIVLADNNGNTWDTAYHYPLLSNYTDSTQLLLFKLNTAGVVSWFKFYGGTSAEYAKCIKRTKDNNFLVLASAQSNDGDVLNHQGGKDIWLLKIDGSNGNIIWQKTYGSTLNETPTDMEILADESIVISGTADASSFLPSAYSGANAFLIKLDKNGTIVWKKTLGGNGEDEIRNCIATGDGGFACIGTTTSQNGDIPVSFGGSDVFISKHAADGSLSWIKMYGNSNNDKAGDIVFTSCNDAIYASFAKEFNNDIYYSGYPAFIQITGVEIGIKIDGTPFHYHENNFAYPASTALYNEGFTLSMAPNTRGGFLGASITHKNWTVSEVTGYLYTRSFDFIEYGDPLNKYNFDTTICSGNIVWGHTFTKDTTFSDTLRNACLIDTAISTYMVHVRSTADSIIAKDSSVCYGQIYDGSPVTVSFFDHDTTYVSNICGNKRIITNTHVLVSDLFLNVVRSIGFTPGQAVTLTPQTNGIISWQANPTLSCLNCQSTIASPVQTTTYYLSSQKGNCILSDSIKLTKNGFYFYVPTAFTPNGDRLNDSFNALASGISEYDMQIYNRWGQMIFRTNSLTAGWNGKFLNADQPIGAYTYMISYTDNAGVRQLVHGTFTLIR